MKPKFKAAGILFTDGKSVLVLKRAGEGENIGTWGLPGGKGKQDETEIETASREAKEETGLESIPGSQFNSLSNQGDGDTKFTAFFYWIDEPFDVSISKEHSAYKWVPLKELKSEDLHPKFRENLSKYLTAIRRKITSFSEWSQLTQIIQELQ